jgi:F0F1-type ATP synthase membrane subunit b/b'
LEVFLYERKIGLLFNSVLPVLFGWCLAQLDSSSNAINLYFLILLIYRYVGGVLDKSLCERQRKINDTLVEAQRKVEIGYERFFESRTQLEEISLLEALTFKSAKTFRELRLCEIINDGKKYFSDIKSILVQSLVAKQEREDKLVANLILCAAWLISKRDLELLLSVPNSSSLRMFHKRTRYEVAERAMLDELRDRDSNLQGSVFLDVSEVERFFADIDFYRKLEIYDSLRTGFDQDGRVFVQAIEPQTVWEDISAKCSHLRLTIRIISLACEDFWCDYCQQLDVLEKSVHPFRFFVEAETSYSIKVLDKVCNEIGRYSTTPPSMIQWVHSPWMYYLCEEDTFEFFDCVLDTVLLHILFENVPTSVSCLD